MNNKQKIINEIKNGEKKNFYQDCMKKGCAFDIIVDGHKYEFRPRDIDSSADNDYAEFGAIAWSKDKEYEFKSDELEFVLAEELAEKRAKYDVNWDEIDKLFAAIAAN